MTTLQSKLSALGKILQPWELEREKHNRNKTTNKTTNNQHLHFVSLLAPMFSFGQVPKVALHQPLGPLWIRHTVGTQLSMPRYINAFYNTPSLPTEGIRERPRGLRLQTSIRSTSHPGLIATQQTSHTDCLQELSRHGLTATRRNTGAQQSAESPPARPAFPGAPRPCRN